MFLDQYPPIPPGNLDRMFTHICQFLYILSQLLVLFEKNKEVHEEEE